MSPAIPLSASVILLLGTLAAGAGQAAGSSSASTTTAATPAGNAQPESPHAAADAYTRRLLTLMDTDKSGKVSKQEFMSYMEAEFERLDVNKDGELDVAELNKLHMRPGIGVHR